MSARQRAQRPGDALQQSTSPGYGSHRIYANVSINGSAPVRFMVDTGADVTVLSSATANQIRLNTRNTAGSLNLVGVAGSHSAPLVNVTLQIETQPGFQTQIAVTNSNFNLLSIKDLSRVYDIVISGGQSKLTPRAGVAAINTLPPAQEMIAPMPTMSLSPDQIQKGVGLVALLLVVSMLS